MESNNKGSGMRENERIEEKNDVVAIDVVASQDDIEVPSFPKPHVRESTAFGVNPLGLLGIGNARSSSTAPSFKPPEFNEIIAGRRLTPFSRQDFRSYLIKRSIEELLDYYLNVTEFRSRFKRDVQAKIKDAEKEAYVVSKCLSSNVKDPFEIGKAIANEFIREGAKKEINISAGQRNEILKYYFPEEFGNNKNNNEATKQLNETGELQSQQKDKDDDSDAVSVFDNSFNEVEQLMYMNAYEEFLSVASSMNITNEESWVKMKISFKAAAIAAIVLGVIIWAEAVGRLTTRWLRVIVFPFMFMIFAGIVTYQTNLCFVCAHYNITIVNTGLDLADAKKKDAVQQICDLFAKESIRKRSTTNLIKIISYAILATGIVLALPPYNTM